jgi:AcrR family transcriptional regulator
LVYAILPATIVRKHPVAFFFEQAEQDMTAARITVVWLAVKARGGAARANQAAKTAILPQSFGLCVSLKVGNNMIGALLHHLANPAGHQLLENRGQFDIHAHMNQRLTVTLWLNMGAMRELLLEKDFKKISVSDIVNRADVGRATFYAHFEDKEDLQAFMFRQLIAQLEAQIEVIRAYDDPSPHQLLVPSLALFRIAKEKHRWFKMYGDAPGIGLTMLRKPLVERLERQLAAAGSSDMTGEIPTRLIANYLISALIALLADWVIEDMPRSPEEMDAIYQGLAEPTLKRLTGA